MMATTTRRTTTIKRTRLGEYCTTRTKTNANFVTAATETTINRTTTQMSEGQKIFLETTKRALSAELSSTSHSLSSASNDDVGVHLEEPEAIGTVTTTTNNNVIKKLGTLLLRSRIFTKLVDIAYQTCDTSGKGHINRDELYSGLLVVHIKMAKFAGPAACHPPSKQVSDDLFFAISDVDRSGGICREEFEIILGVCFAQILFRVLINYCTMIFVIPWIASKIVTKLGAEEGSYKHTLCEQLTGLIMFFFLIPIVWGRIDKEAQKEAQNSAERQRLLSARSTLSDSGDDDRRNSNRRRRPGRTKRTTSMDSSSTYQTGTSSDDEEDTNSSCPSLVFTDSNVASSNKKDD